MLRLTACVGVFCLLCAHAASGLGLSLREARLLEMDGQREAAARLYADWLQANPRSPQAPMVFMRYLDAEQSYPALEQAAGRLLHEVQARAADPKTAAEEPDFSGVLMRMARLLEIAGKIEEARDAYLAASAAGGPASAIEGAFLLSLEMNDTGALRSSLAALKDGPGSGRRELLEACLSLQQGDAGPARAALARIGAEEKDPQIALKALWLSYEMALRSGDTAAKQQAATLLQARFPRSPECAMAASAASADVSPIVLPAQFFAGPLEPQSSQPSQGQALQAPPAPSAPAPPAQTAQPAQGPPASGAVTLSVQAGSFQMKENADDLVRELSRKGFSPTIREESLQGKPLFRILAGSGLTEEDARALLDRLHREGFSGFLLKDP